MSVPVKIPPAPGLSPSVTLNYSSGSVDGLSMSTNNQTSVIGEGWSLGGVSFVERSYRPCKDDGLTWADDLCWVGEAPVSIVLSGQSSQLLVDSNGLWFPEDASLGWKVEHLTGASNGVWNGEHFRVTTMDGTVYLFGATASASGGGAMKMLVISNETGEPCNVPGNIYWSGCYMGWRWNLESVTDRFGNTMAYSYSTYTNKYGALGNAAPTLYDMSATLMNITYGANTRGSTTASGRVDFTYDWRCFAGTDCTTHSDASYWPDTPWDQFCHWDATTCPGHTAPTFWTVYRLIKIESKAFDYAPPGTWQTTEILNLWHQFPATGDYISPAGDDTPPSLWLGTINKQNDTENLFTAGGVRLVNRVFWGNDLARSPMMHYRIDNVYWGTGAHTTVSYSGEECTRTNVYNGATDHNVLRCYPQWEDDQFRWYHKYVVTQVSAADMPASGNPAVVTRYSYTFDHVTSTQGQEYANAMWRFDDNWLMPMSRRTFSKWRGYPTVLTYTGNADGTGLQTLSQDVYFRGMNGDRSGGVWGARQVSVTDGTTTYTDHEGMAGKLLRHTTFDTQNGGVWRDMQITKYTAWAAGTMSTGGGNPPSLSAWKVLPTQSQTILNVPGSPAYTRTTTVNTTYDTTYPIVTKVEDLGETQATTNPVGTADDKCTMTSYVPADTSRWLIGFPKETITTDCTATPVAGSYLGGTRTYYDSQALGVIGAGTGMGKITKSEALVKATAAPPSASDWLVSGQTTVYDTYGRATTTIDAAGRSTVTVYTPAANVTGAVKTVGVTTTGTVPTTLTLGTTSTDLDIRFGTPVKITDVNSKITRAEYDWHGYLTKVWKNHRAPGSTSGITPDAEYRYVIRGNLPSYVGTKLLAPDGTSQMLESFAYFDGLLRPRRAETPGANGTDRAVTDTLYGTTGQTARVLSVSLTGNPNANFDTWNGSAAFQDYQFGYNGFSQQKTITPYSQGVALGTAWNTTTITDGLTITVTPPQGGTITTTVSNAQGKTSELRQAKPSGGTLNTTYAYDRLGQLKTVKDPANNTWTYAYDLLGRKTAVTDPDTGTVSTTYTAGDLVLSTTDARNQQLWNEYDSLSRKVALHANTQTGTVLSQWAYDSATFTVGGLPVKGQLSSTTRKNAAGDYKTEINNYNNAYHAEKTTFTAPGFGTGGGTLTYINNATFNANGTAATTVSPAAGGLLNETLTYAYNAAGFPSSVTSTLGSTTSPLIASTVYKYDGKVDTQILGAVGKQVKNNNAWELATGRLLTSTMSTETATQGSFGAKLIKGYSYDPVGNISGTSNNYPGTATDNGECFSYDTLRRLTQAWTQSMGTACTTPQKAGPDPYWRTWTVDDIGNRSSEVDKNADGTEANKWNYTNGATGSVKPHQVKTIAPTSGNVRTFGYDDAGNMTSRTTETAVAQTLTWDNENHLAAVTGGDSASYVYNVDGSRLLATNTVGGVTKSTLYLPDGTELEKYSAGLITGQRYVGGVAVRDSVTGLQWTIGNHQGSTLAQVNASDLTVYARQMAPYGQPRGTQPTWVGTKGYVGGTTDAPSGLTHLGAREYDPTIGRFISTDPVMDLTDPQQWHPYTYSNNNPVTASDPGGLNLTYDNAGEASACGSYIQCVASGEVPVDRAPKAPAGGMPDDEPLGTPTPEPLPTPVPLTCIGSNCPTSFESFIIDVTIGDGIDCVKGEVSGCLLFGANFIPGGKLAAGGVAALKALKLGLITASEYKALYKVGFVVDDLWSLPGRERGLLIEALVIEERGMKGLPNNFKTIDSFDNGVATSIKSRDLYSNSYSNGSGTFLSRMTDDIDKLAKFDGASLKGVTVRGADITRRDLVIVINKLNVSGDQYKAIVQAFNYGRSQGVNVSFVVIT